MNLPDQKYDTISESNYVREFLQKHKDILKLKELSRKCGMEQTKLISITSGVSKTIAPDQLKKLSKILQELNFELPIRLITIEYIQQKITKKSGISLEEMRKKKNKRPVTEEKQIIMYLCKELITKISYEKIGEYFGIGKIGAYNSIKTVSYDFLTNNRIKNKVENYLKMFEQ
ncbi:MAG: helix-turn-helix domain-containing protein [Clostridia bacterium]